MPQPIPYLAFNGNCAEAMRLYERALNGTLDAMMTNAQSPWAAEMPQAGGDRILHASLQLKDNGTLYAGDCPQSTTYEGIKGVSFALNYNTVEEGQRVFRALLEGGGTVTMPMQPTFWAKSWGMLVDCFGVAWIVNGERIPF